MGDLNNLARNLIMLSVRKIGKRETAKIYSIPHVVIDQYILGVDMGTLTAREILTIDLALKRGEKITDRVKYKGGRQR